MNGIRISAVVPTHNRCRDLARCLEALAAQEFPPERSEVVVVDNDSTDGTRETAERFIRAHPDRSIVLAREDELGLGPARNAGIRASRGDVVAFIDDDASASPHWLACLVDAHERWRADIVGGRVVLEFPGKRPAWLSGKLEACLSAVDLGGKARPVRYPEQLVGTNISFRRAWLDKTGGFDPALDRKGTSLMSGGDTDLLWKMQRMGARAVYEPAAVVTHRIPPGRLTRRWFLRRLYQGERSNLVLNVRYEGRLRAMRQAGTIARRLGRAAARRRPDLFGFLIESARLAGYLRAMGYALFPIRAFLEELAAARPARLHSSAEIEGGIVTRMDAELDGVRVLGWTLAGGTVKLYFEIQASRRARPLIFRHLYPESCAILSPERRPHGFFNLDHRAAVAARGWRRGGIYVDELDLRDFPAGKYRLAFGLCDAKTLRRIPVRKTGADRIEIGPFRLG